MTPSWSAHFRGGNAFMRNAKPAEQQLPATPAAAIG
jgi:hypothetical protein